MSARIRRNTLPALLLLASVGSANGQSDTIYKCVSADGSPIYQSNPCAEPASQAWARPIAEYAPTTATGKAAAPRARKPASARPHAPRNGGRAAGRSAHSSRCAAEKHKVAAERDERWMHISIDDLRRMDARVARACD